MGTLAEESSHVTTSPRYFNLLGGGIGKHERGMLPHANRLIVCFLKCTLDRVMRRLLWIYKILRTV